MPVQREFLVVVRAGAKSLHASWVDVGSPRSFDLLVAAYAKDAPVVEDEGVIRVDLPGWKVQGFAKLFATMPELLAKYHYIALIDDDIATSQRDLEFCFAAGKAASLRVWQPSLTWDSYFSHASLLTNPAFRLRYVNFVEMMCPFFEADYLRKILPVFGLGYETGIDTVWTRFMKDGRYRVAVIDSVAVRHTRPVGSLKQMQGFPPDQTYDLQVGEVTKLFGVSFGGGFAHAALKDSGAVIVNRFLIALKSLGIAQALVRTPMDRLTAARLIAAFIRHTIAHKLEIGGLTEFRVENVPKLAKNNYT